MNVAEGRRQSAADAYLRPVRGRGNLAIVTDALVTRLVFEGHRCRGVDYAIGGQAHRVEVDHEVIVCAGTVGSAQLLMRSGIGPARHLCHNGIDVLVDAPGVGQNLHDHTMCWITYAAASPLPSTHAVPHVLLRSSGDVEPDLQIGFAPVVFGPRWLIEPIAGFSVTFSVMTPFSRGSVQLSGPDPRDPLRIDPAYFADRRDLDRMVTAMRRAREIAEADALTRWRGASLIPVDVSDDAACRRYVRATAGSYFHPVGTCRIGSDPLAVVDPRLRVTGVDGLRVADASVMPAIISANTNATVLAIAERAAALTLSDRDADSGWMGHAHAGDTRRRPGMTGTARVESHQVPGASGVDTEREGAESSMRAGMAVAAQDRRPRLSQA
jgi:choline dehydrogenase